MAKKKAPKTVAKIKNPSAQKRKGGGSKLSRSEIIQVRIDPKLRFTAELAARKHRRTLSSFIEWAVSEGVRQVTVGFKENETADYVASKVWDIDEADRFVKLATKFPHLLTHDEEVLWKLICEKQKLWLFQDDLKAKLRLEKNPDKINMMPLRETMDHFRSYLSGDMSEDEKSGFDEFICTYTSSLDLHNKKGLL